MNLTDEQRDEIRAAICDMAIADWPISDPDIKSYANRVTWWLENSDKIAAGDE